MNFLKKILTISGILLLSSGNMLAIDETMESNLNANEKAFVLSRFCNEVKYNFAFYDDLSFNWDSLCIAVMPELVATKSDKDFLEGLQALCSRLKDGHTSIFALNNPQNSEEWIRPFPMKTKRIGDRVFVSDVFSTVLQNSGVKRGTEILEIDDEKVITYAQKHIQPFLASSTQQWTDFRPFAEYELTKDAGSRVSKILFRDKKGKEFIFKSNRLIPWDIPQSETTLSFSTLKGNLGLLTVKSFQDSEFDRERFDELYNEILKTDALIIDIRDNGGGNSAHADYLISHFCNKPIPQGRWKSPMYIAAHASWHYPKEWYTETPEPILPTKEKDIYTKPIVLLVNSTTFSSAENFCVSFKGARRGKIIGTPTGGSSGNPIIMDLGYGIGCCICTKHELDSDGNEFIGIGIQPDVIVEEDVESYLKSKDKILDTALDLIIKEVK